MPQVGSWSVSSGAAGVRARLRGGAVRRNHAERRRSLHRLSVTRISQPSMLLIPKISRVAQQPEKHLLINVLRIRAASLRHALAGKRRRRRLPSPRSGIVGAQLLVLHGVLSSFL